MHNIHSFILIFFLAMLASCDNSKINFNLVKPAKIFSMIDPYIYTPIAFNDEPITVSPELDKFYVNTPIAYSCFYDQVNDSSVLELNKCGNLAGMNFNKSSGAFNWSPEGNVLGIYEFKIIAKALGAATEYIFWLELNQKNARPVIDDVLGPDLVFHEGIEKTLTFNIHDDDNIFSELLVSCTYQNIDCNTSLPGASFVGNELTFTPDYDAATVGIYPIIIRASDGIVNEFKLFNLSVIDVPRAPSLLAESDLNLIFKEDELKTVNFVHSPDGLSDYTLTCSYLSGACSDLLGTASFSNGVLSYTPNNIAQGTHAITVALLQVGIEVSSQVYTLEVNNTFRAPTFIELSLLELTSVENVNSVIDFVSSPDGVGGYQITCSYLGGDCSDLPGGASFLNGKLTYQPSFSAEGAHEIIIGIKPPSLPLVVKNYELVVLDSFRAPTYIAAGSLNLNFVETVGPKSINFFSKPDGNGVGVDLHTYTCSYLGADCSTLPGVASFSDGALSYTPASASEGSYAVVIKMFKDGTEVGTGNYTLEVTKSFIPPSFDESLAAVIQVQEGPWNNINFFTRPDGNGTGANLHTYTCTYAGSDCAGNLPGFATFANGTLTYRPTYNPADFMIGITVTKNGPGIPESRNYTLEILKKPIAITVVHTANEQTFIENQYKELEIYQFPDGISDYVPGCKYLGVDCAISALPGVVTFTNGVFSFIPNVGAAGSYSLSVSLNGYGASSSASFSITVVKPNTQPVLTDLSDITYTALVDITFNVNTVGGTAADRDADGDTISYSLACEFEGAACNLSITSQYTFSSLTGAFSMLKPLFSRAGEVKFTIVGNDNRCASGFFSNCTDTKKFSIFVEESFFDSLFITTWKIPPVGEGDLVVKLPINATLPYNFKINWGDATATTVQSMVRLDGKALSRTYNALYRNQEVTIVIAGVIDGLKTNNTISKLIRVDNLGDLAWKNFDSAFTDAANLTSISGGETGQVTTMRMMFNENTGLQTLNIGHWDVRNVVDMSEMFWGISASVLPINNWQPLRLKNVDTMFGGIEVNTLDLSNWNLPELESSLWMFNSFWGNEINLSNWNVPKLKLTYEMLAYTDAEVINLSGWYSPSLEVMEGMVLGSSNLKHLYMRGWGANFSNLLASGNYMIDGTSTPISQGSPASDNFIDIEYTTPAVNLYCDQATLFGFSCIP